MRQRDPGQVTYIGLIPQTLIYPRGDRLRNSALRIPNYAPNSLGASPTPLDKVWKNYIIREIYFISWGIAKRVRSVGKVVGESLLTALPKKP